MLTDQNLHQFYKGSFVPIHMSAWLQAVLFSGHPGSTLAAMCVAVIVPLVNFVSVIALFVWGRNQNPTLRGFLMPVIRNPLVMSCLGGIGLQSSRVERSASHWPSAQHPWAGSATIRPAGSRRGSRFPVNSRCRAFGVCVFSLQAAARTGCNVHHVRYFRLGWHTSNDYRLLFSTAGGTGVLCHGALDGRGRSSDGKYPYLSDSCGIRDITFCARHGQLAKLG